MCFFVGKLLDIDLGYRAHYYGPYSDRVAAEVGFLSANDYVFELRRGSGVADNRGWEVARFDYRLTERGEAGLTWLDQQFAEQSKAVKEGVRKVLAAGDLNYIGLSLAAKTYWILTAEGRPMSFESVAEKSNQFRWTVSEEDVRRASDFLQKLNLASIAQQRAS